MKSTAIIGGGIAGMVTGMRLHQKGHPFIVYEATGRVGGVVQSMRQNGYLAEFGPNTLLETSPKITEMIRAAGLEKRMMYSDSAASNRYLVRSKRTVAMPTSPFAFMGTSLFSFGTKLRLFKEPFVPRWDNRYEESIAQFVQRRLGQEFLDYAIDALVAGIYAGDPYRLSVMHGFPKLYTLEQKYGSMIKGQIFGAKERKRRGEVSKQDAKKISFDEGLQVLPDTLASHFLPNIKMNAEVVQISRHPNGWSVRYRKDGKEQEDIHGSVLWAIPTYKMIDISLDREYQTALAPLGKIVYPPVASVVLGYRRQDVAHPLDGFGMLIPGVEKFRILGTLYSSSLFPNRAPSGFVTLTSYVGGMRNPELATRSPDELFQMTDEDLRQLLNIQGKPTFKNFVLYPRAIPQYEVGYGQFKTIMDSLEKDAPGWFFAGHYRHGISLGDTIISAYDVADRIHQFLSNSPSQK